jgi:hypothetical protein
MRAAHLSQYRLDTLPKLLLLPIAGFSKERSFLSGFGDGFGALRCKKVACKCRNIRCIHFWILQKTLRNKILFHTFDQSYASHAPSRYRRHDAALGWRLPLHGCQRFRDRTTFQAVAAMSAAAMRKRTAEASSRPASSCTA